MLHEVIVEWDENKEKSNFMKHGVLFETARLVFADENRIEFYDEAHSIGEERYRVIGRVGLVLVVIYTMRGDAHRIISARVANRREEDLYYGYCKNGS